MKSEIEPPDQIHAGGHHRCGVDQRGDGRRPGHGVRQPDVERELGALAHAAGEDAEPRQRQHPVGNLAVLARDGVLGDFEAARDWA